MMNKIPCQILSVSPQTKRVVRLKIKPLEPFTYLAGQYTYFHLPHDSLPFSIANCPNERQELEFFITVSNPIEEDPLVCTLKACQTLFISAAAGLTTIDKFSRNTLIFIAAGTGISPIKAIIEGLIAINCKKKKLLYWAIKSSQDNFLEQELMDLNNKDDRLTIHYLNRAHQSNRLSLAEQIAHNQASLLARCDVILAGPFPRVLELKHFFLQKGLKEDQLFSDAFHYGE